MQNFINLPHRNFVLFFDGHVAKSEHGLVKFTCSSNLSSIRLDHDRGEGLHGVVEHSIAIWLRHILNSLAALLASDPR